MIFTTYSFLFLFLPITLISYYKLKKNLSWWSLVIASFIFYAIGSPQFFFVFVISVFGNYLIGTLLNRSSKKKYLIFGIIYNLSILGYYKYSNFFIENINLFFGNTIRSLNVVLPIGISFYTFQLIGYLVDSYKGKTKSYALREYLLFISFFPQLIVGPIVHHTTVVKQYLNPMANKFNSGNFIRGIIYFTIGMLKKQFIVYFLSLYTAKVDHFGYSMLGFVDSWLYACTYTIQYYFDLSSYADMAIGLGLMFNVKIPQNFNSPYKATDFAEYWRRWHITLSNFLGDYIFKPFWSKKEHNKKNFNKAVLLTFFVSGIWHGAGWNFVLWGIFNGIFVVMAHQIVRSKIKIPKLVAWSVTMLGVVLMRALFVAPSLKQAYILIKKMFGFNGFHFTNNFGMSKSVFFVLFIGFFISVLFPKTEWWVEKFQPKTKYMLILSIFFVIASLSCSRTVSFLYFQF